MFSFTLEKSAELLLCVLKFGASGSAESVQSGSTTRFWCSLYGYIGLGFPRPASVVYGIVADSFQCDWLAGW